ncbi:MAG: dihydroorotate dehydrogenase electron transfer subunit [Oscillospiraceae bacterium]|nr:dihydroorotate dehydrogenase electron transfer subunit [Oscillospiraceae bacterium]
MKEALFRITENRKIAPLTFLMKAAGDCSGMDRPGQFVNIRIEGLFLRRPISVCDIRDDELTIIYKTVGRGTAAMSQMKPGEELSMLTGLGNGYDLECSGDSPLLIGGGVGIPPLYLLARKLTQQGKRVHAVLGFNRKEEIFFEKEFRDLGCEVTVTTADGSAGVRGFVTDGLPEEYSYFYTCGPEPMLRAVKKATVTSGQFSFEERMGCGFGACMGCTCRTVTGYKRICKDGPVLEKEEILWED